jgi:hypothetical protein
MQRFIRHSALAALVSALAACGGGGSAAGTAAAPAGPSAGASGVTAQSGTGLALPSSVSVVTARNVAP